MVARRNRAVQQLTRLLEDLTMATVVPSDHVAWVEGGAGNARLRVAPIDVGRLLGDSLWRETTAVLCSATIPPKLPDRLGMPKANTTVIDVGSPFDYEANALLYCAAHLPDPRAERDAAVADEIAALIDEAGLDPTRLCFEITENTLIEHLKQVTRVLLRLKKRGFKVAIDDFGTGYSSLAALQNLPVDILKIDQTFVARLGASEKASRIAATIVGLALALGCEVIAEGIETEVQMRELRKLSCALGQGFYYSSPLEGEAVETEVLARYHPALHGRSRREAAGSRGR